MTARTNPCAFWSHQNDMPVVLRISRRPLASYMQYTEWCISYTKFDLWWVERRHWAHRRPINHNRMVNMKFVITGTILVNGSKECPCEFCPGCIDVDERIDVDITVDADNLEELADCVYLENNNTCEGVVVRPQHTMRVPSTGERVSFKVINLKYKD